MDAVEPLVDWFTCNGGTIDRAAIGFKGFVDSGRGAVALRDLDVRGNPTRLWPFQHSKSLHQVGGSHSVHYPAKIASVDEDLVFGERAGRSSMAVAGHRMGELDSVYDVGAI